MDVTHGSLSVLLTFVLLIFPSFGTSGEASTNAVSGVVGREVSFPVKVSPGKRVEKIEWYIISPVSGEPYQLCVFEDWKLTKTDSSTWSAKLSEKISEDTNAMQKNITIWARESLRLDKEIEFVTNLMVEHIFGHQLKMVDRTTLKIRKIEKGKAAIYKARVWFDAEQFEDQYFNVTLYDPAPVPIIHYDDLIKTPEGCHVTLQCYANGAGKYNISWEKVSALREISFSDNSRSLSVSWRKGSPHSTFTCLVHNPADQKKASFDLLKICQDDEGQSHKGSLGRNIPWAPILSIVPAIACLLLMVCMYRKEKSSWRNRGISSVALEGTECHPPPENPVMNLPVMISASESTTMGPPSYDEVQVGWTGEEGTLCLEPPAYDSLFDCSESDPVTHASS